MSRKFCAVDQCREPVSYPSRRFCAKHRREHGQALLAQLAAIDPAALAPRPVERKA